MTLCSICMNDDSDRQSVQLECGHSFHTECIVQWFRHHNTTCPMCRSESIEHMWSRKTPAQRIAIMNRLRHKPPHIRRRLSSIAQWRERKRSADRALKEFTSEYRDLLREYRRRCSAVRLARSTLHRMIRSTASANVPGVPFLNQQLTLYVNHDGWNESSDDDD